VVRYFANLYIKKPDEELQAQALQLAGMEEAPLPCCRNVIVGVHSCQQARLESNPDAACGLQQF